MSSLGSVMNSAMNSLIANQLALSVASNNISNAQTPGYSRERVDLTPAGPAGPDGVGDGVSILGVEALRDQLTTSRLNQETSARSAQDSMQQALHDIQGAFNDSNGTGMMSELTAFFNSFQTLSTDPTSMTNREGVKQSALALIDAFHSQASNLQNQQSLANQAVSTDVDKINSLTTRIAGITQQIQQLEGGGQQQNALRDQRGQLVQQLSQIADVREVNDSDGSYQLSLASGPALVLNGSAQALTAKQGAGGSYSVVSGNQDVTSQITSGDLGAQLQLRDQVVPGYLNQLDQLAFQVTQQVNGIHSGGYTLDGNTGINFFTPLSSASGAASAIEVSSDITSSTRNIAASQDGSSGDNSAAIALGNLSVTDQYSSLVYNVGRDAAAAQSGFQEHDALVTQLQNRQQSVSGVSIDEETANILQFQQSYQASAKLISSVDQMMQTALAMVGTVTTA
jgi:flagellar hook-associated protein 1 FlgK